MHFCTPCGTRSADTPSSNALDGFTDEGGRDLSELPPALGGARGTDRSEACRAWHRSAKAPTIGDQCECYGRVRQCQSSRAFEPELMNYSTILRVIGQALDPLRPQTYEVVSYGDCYLVRCRVKEDAKTKKEEKKTRGLTAFLRLWREPENPAIRENPADGTSMNVELLYSLEELKRLDEERKKT